MKETPITNKILKYLNSLPNCKAIKRHGGMFGRAGEPDITGCKDGKHFEIEVKVPGKEPEPIQDQRRKEWQAAGAFAFWTDNLELVKRKIYDKEKSS